MVKTARVPIHACEVSSEGTLVDEQASDAQGWAGSGEATFRLDFGNGLVAQHPKLTKFTELCI